MRGIDRSRDSEFGAASTPTLHIAADAHRQETLPPGSRIGRYFVLGELGSGGMGVVYRAYDPKLQREIALKCLKSSMLSPRARAQMIREAQAMAKLSHPNVVAVHDVELDGEGVVLAMEYVEGVTLRVWMAATERPWRGVIDCLSEAGRGLAAAHDVGLLHRDFKPGNVLVGADGRTRVSDFGLARVPVRGPTEAEVASPNPGLLAGVDSPTLNDAVMGTPVYMAPEQYAPHAALDHRADQYAFCVSLWEALTGAPPFAWQGDLAAHGRAKLEGPPPWPRAVAVPRRIVRAIERGLSPAAVDRWPSMHALLQELAPIRRAWITPIGVALAASVVAGSLSAWLSTRDTASVCTGAAVELRSVWDDSIRAALDHTMSQHVDERIREGRARTIDALQTYASTWLDAHTDACLATNERREQSEAVMDLRMACLRRARSDFDATVQVLGSFEATDAANLDRLIEGLPPLHRCSDVDALQQTIPPPGSAPLQARVNEARDALSRARTLSRAGRYAEAEAVVDGLIDSAEQLDYPPLRTELLEQRGWLYEYLGRYREAEAVMIETLKLGLEWGQWDEAHSAALLLIGLVGDRLGRPDEGLAYAHTALGLGERPGFGALQEASVRNSIGAVLGTQGRWLEAELEHRRSIELREQALGPEHPKVSISRENLAIVLRELGRLDAAETEQRRALAMRQRAYGPLHPEVATGRYNLAETLSSQGRWVEAEIEFRIALYLWERTLGAEHPLVGLGHVMLGSALRKLDRLEEAILELERGLAVRRRVAGPEDPAVDWGDGELALAKAAIERRTEG